MDDVLERVALRSGVADVVGRLPAGWSSPLSPGYTNGSSLSGGQWQKIALARVLFAIEAGARLLVLDEPTASLDVRAEASFYDSFLSLTRDGLPSGAGALTTLLISHRLATVRQADRIVLLSNGRIIEDGTHDALLAHGGLYARMFEAQAGQFAESSAEA